MLLREFLAKVAAVYKSFCCCGLCVEFNTLYMRKYGEYALFYQGNIFVNISL
jgi:hypothetical protein